MFRKLTFVFVVAMATGAAALAPTAASAAWHGGGGWHNGGWHGGGWHGPRVIVGAPYGFYGGYGGCLVRRLVETPFGLQVHWMNVC
jgi:hypothetical protein